MNRSLQIGYGKDAVPNSILKSLVRAYVPEAKFIFGWWEVVCEREP